MFKSIFAASALCIAAMNVAAQTADEIVAKHITAMGGAEKMATLNTVKMEGNLSMQGMDIPVVITKTHLKGNRLDLEIMGSSNYQIMNDKTGWLFFPVQQMDAPQEMPAEQYASAKSQLDIRGALLNYKDKGYTVEAAGTEKVGGKDAHKLKVNKGTETSTYYIDAATGYLLKTSAKREMQGQSVDIETSYSDYKKNAEGFVFAYSMTVPQGTMTFEKITANGTVDEKIYSN
ncbi:MAG: outer membrane lipoprotein-sorting protein [Chitinophagaceae bacterium]|nr:MAG: outer membrane lipoprotein-sorting protein [Chitinophagaceae bacterium]